MLEQTIPKYLDQAKGFGIDLEEMVKQRKLEMVYIRPLDLSVDETLYTIQRGGAGQGDARRTGFDFGTSGRACAHLQA